MKVYSIEKYAEMLGVSKQAAYKRLTKEKYNKHLTIINGKRYVKESIFSVENIEYGETFEVENDIKEEEYQPNYNDFSNENKTNNNTENQTSDISQQLIQILKEKEKDISILTNIIAEKDKQIGNLINIISEYNKKYSELITQANELTRNNQILMLNQQPKEEKERTYPTEQNTEQPQNTKLSRIINFLRKM